MSTKVLTKNKPYSLRIKLVKKRPDLQNPRRYGPKVKGDLAEIDRFMPVLMHGEIIRSYELRSGKWEVPSKHVTNLDVRFASFYSRVLDMKIMCRVSPSALWYIDQYGGFDEYMMYAPERLFTDWVAQFYRRRIYEGFCKKQQQLRQKMLEIASESYGEAYVLKLKSHHEKVDSILLEEIREKQLNTRTMAPNSSLLTKNAVIWEQDLKRSVPNL